MDNAHVLAALDQSVGQLRANEARLRQELEARLAPLQDRIRALTITRNMFAADAGLPLLDVPDAPPLAEDDPIMPNSARSRDAAFWREQLGGLTHAKALVKVAEMNDGLLRPRDAITILFVSGLAGGRPENLRPHVYDVIRQSGRFERVSSGLFRLRPEMQRPPEGGPAPNRLRSWGGR